MTTGASASAFTSAGAFTVALTVALTRMATTTTGSTIHVHGVTAPFNNGLLTHAHTGHESFQLIDGGICNGCRGDLRDLSGRSEGDLLRR